MSVSELFNEFELFISIRNQDFEGNIFLLPGSPVCPNTEVYGGSEFHHVSVDKFVKVNAGFEETFIRRQ